MKSARKFFWGLLAGFALALTAYATAFGLNLGVPTESSRWCFEINQKKCLAAARITTPKLLLVGGSGTLFGIQAGEIQKQTGRPTVNLGTHAVLGAAYILREARQVAKPGDVVLLTFEYELYTTGRFDPSMADKGFIDYILSRDPAYFRGLTLVEKWNFFMLTPWQRLQKGLKNRLHAERRPGDPGVYDSALIDEYGDQTGRETRKRAAATEIQARKSTLASGLPKHPAGFEPIESFCRWALANHIRVLATYPNLCDQPEYHQPFARDESDRIQRFFRGLAVPVLGDYQESLLPVDSFFDTNYHLTGDASFRRTQKLLVKLKPYLGQPTY